MRKYIALLVLMAAFLFAAYLESPGDTVGFESVFSEEVADSDVKASREVMGQQGELVRSFYEFVQEDVSTENGEFMETYREYEFFEGKDGEIIKKIPTDNYNYLKYQLETE